MTHIKLNCTYGGVKNPTLEIGEGISLTEAESLVSEGLGKPYTPDGLTVSDARVLELEGQVSDLTARNAELEGQVSDLTARNAELEGQFALLSPAPAAPPKGGK